MNPGLEKRRKTVVQQCWGGALLSLLVASVVGAQPMNRATPANVELSMAERLEAMEFQVAALQATERCSASCWDELLASEVTCQNSGLYAGFAFVFLKPHFKESFQATTADATGVLQMVPFEYGYDVTPRAWLGFVDAGGLGVRTRYWQYDQAADRFQSAPFTAAQVHVVTVIFPATIAAMPPHQVLNVADALEVRTVDLEGTQEVRLGVMSLVASGGLRYAMMRQQMEASVTDGDELEQALRWQRRFEGIGPVIGLEVERSLGGAGLAFVGAFRGALLFGDKDLDRTEWNGLGMGPPIVTLKGAKEVLGIGEMELGLQWSRRLPNGSDLFVAGTYEGHLWSDSGTPTLGYLGFQGFGVKFGVAR